MLSIKKVIGFLLFLNIESVIITNTNEVFYSHPNVSLPDSMHRFLYNIPKDQRILLIGDVHGCFRELQLLLKKANYAAQDILIFVGDMLDRGPDSYDVLRFIQSTPNVFCIRGNHEDDVLGAYYLYRMGYEVSSMHRELVQQMTLTDLKYLEQLPYTITIPDRQIQTVHAGYLPHKPFFEQHPYHMVKLHTVLRNETTHEFLIERNRSQVNAYPWAKLYDGKYHVYFGHDSKRGLQLYEHATGLDTGCVKGKQMTAMVLPQQEIIQVNCETNYT